jgi:FkbM family methyltransferase
MECVFVELNGHKIDLGPNPSKICKQRWLGELSPEPETVAWIESLPVGASFLDIGASVGTHAVRAALHGLKVTAIEPHQASYEELVQVVSRNTLPIRCLNFALSSEVSSGILGHGRSKYTFYAGPQVGGQPIAALTLDAFYKTEITGYPVPTYIKLDVDGNEAQIIEGGRGVFNQVKSALIEVDPIVNPAIPAMMARLGFHFDKQQVEECMIKEGKYKGMANYIFYR